MSTEPDDLDAFLAEKATDPAFALHWEALQARKRADRPATTDQTTQVHGPTPVERARSVVTDTIAAARIRGDGPWTTADAVLTALEREGYTVAPKVVFPHKGMTAEQVAEWRKRWKAAVRASHGHQGATGTPDGTQVTAERTGAAETPSEPRPMRPEDVPGKILAEALEAWTGYDDPLNECAAVDIETAATILAAVIPAIRAQVADEIARDICEPMDDCDRPSCPDCIRHEYAQRLARRIRGDQ